MFIKALFQCNSTTLLKWMYSGIYIGQNASYMYHNMIILKSILVSKSDNDDKTLLPKTLES